MKTVTLASLFALALSSAALAQQPQQPSQGAQPQRSAAPTFEAADKNKDGMINRDEASAVPGLDFTAADSDRNSSLDREEYTAAVARVPRPRS